MKIKIVFLIGTLALLVGGSKYAPVKQPPVYVGGFYIPQNKKFWVDHVFPNNFNPEIAVKSNGVNYTLNICTNFCIYYIKTTDPDFTTQEGISPGMSYAQVKKNVKHPKLFSNNLSDIFSTNEPVLTFYLQLTQHWNAWFRGEYKPPAKSPDDNDHIVFLDCGLPHTYFEKGAILIPESQFTNKFPELSLDSEE